MKFSLTLLFACYLQWGYSQIISDSTVIQGKLNSNYFLLDAPRNPEGNGLKLLSPGDFLYIVNAVSTTRNPPQDLWYHCFYKNIEGFIPTSVVDIYGDYSTEKMNYLISNKDKTYPTRLEITKRVSTYEGRQQDSLSKIQTALMDSLTIAVDNKVSQLINQLQLNAKKEKLLIISYSYPTSILNYPGFKIRFINGSEKSIKYVTFTLNAYNRVKDLIGKKEVRCIGEIEPFENKEYEFKNVFISEICDNFNIPSVKIQYMDNSLITLSGNQLLVNYLRSPLAKLSELKDFEFMIGEIRNKYIREKYSSPQ